MFERLLVRLRIERRDAGSCDRRARSPRHDGSRYHLAGTQTYDPVLFAEALKAAAEHRGTLEQIKDVDSILADIEGSAQLREMWEKYRKQFSYASEISWGAIVAQLRKLTTAIQP